MATGASKADRRLAALIVFTAAALLLLAAPRHAAAETINGQACSSTVRSRSPGAIASGAIATSVSYVLSGNGTYTIGSTIAPASASVVVCIYPAVGVTNAKIRLSSKQVAFNVGAGTVALKGVSVVGSSGSVVFNATSASGKVFGESVAFDTGTSALTFGTSSTGDLAQAVAAFKSCSFKRFTKSAIATQQALTISGVTVFSDNDNTDGGFLEGNGAALRVSAATVSLSGDIVFARNAVFSRGGAIYAFLASINFEANSTAVFANNQVSDGDGGAIHAAGGVALNFEAGSSVVFANNSAGFNGGAIFSLDSDATFVGDVSFFGNSASEGSALWFFAGNAAFSSSARACFAGNPSPGGEVRLEGTAAVQIALGASVNFAGDSGSGSFLLVPLQSNPALLPARVQCLSGTGTNVTWSSGAALQLPIVGDPCAASCVNATAGCSCPGGLTFVRPPTCACPPLLAVASVTRSPNTAFVLLGQQINVTACLNSSNGAGAATVKLTAVPSTNAVVTPATNLTGSNGCATFSAKFNSAGSKSFTVNATKAGFVGAVATGQAQVKATKLLKSLTASATPLYVNVAFTLTASVDTAVTSFTNATVTISSPNSGFSCTGSLSKTARTTTGVASFSGCKFTTAGNKTIIATATTTCGAGCGLPPTNVTLKVLVLPYYVLGVGCPAVTSTTLTPSSTFPGGTLTSATTLVLNATGTYTISNTLVPAANVTLCVVAGAGVTGATLVLGGTATSHVSLDNEGAKLVLRGVTLRGVGSSNSSVSVKSCAQPSATFVADSAIFDSGGCALACDAGQPSESGAFQGKATLQSCTFRNFLQTAVKAAKATAELAIQGTSVFANNTGTAGGALSLIFAKRATIGGTATFSGNTCSGYGGAVASFLTPLEFTANARVSFTNNSAAIGGGALIAVLAGSVAVRPGANLTFTSNRVLGTSSFKLGGGAITVAAQTSMLINSTARVCLNGNTVAAGDPIGGEISLLNAASLVIQGTVSSAGAGAAGTPGIVLANSALLANGNNVNSTVACGNGGTLRSSTNTTLSFVGDVCASSCLLAKNCSCPVSTSFKLAACACTA